MKKISSKILISFVLATFLWSGVGGFRIQKSFAQETPNPCTELKNAVGTAPLYNPFGENLEFEAYKERYLAYQKCLEDQKGPGFWEGLVIDAGTAIMNGIAKVVMVVNGIILQLIVIPLASFLLRIAGSILNNAIEFTLSTKIFYEASNGINLTWSIVRNIFNITFIFILLWTAIKTILGSAGTNTKKMIANVVIAALLINFSLFITRTIIDAGNILGVTLYKKITTSATGNTGLGSILMDNLGMSTLMSTAKAAATAGSSDGGSGWAGALSVEFGIVSYMQLLLILVALFTFIYAALLMAVRLVALIFLAATSPIGFVGDILPKLSEYSKMWRETLYGQVMVAPIFLLFVYLIINMSSAFTEVNIKASGLKDTSYLTYFTYILTIVLLIVAVKTTKKMSGPIGAAMEGTAKMIGGAAIGLATGGAAMVMRGTMGRIGKNLADSQSLKDASVNGNWTQRQGAKATMALGGIASKKSFDFRNISAVSDAAKKHLGVDVKEGAFGTKFASAAKGGYAGRISEQQKSAEEKAKKLSEGISASKGEIAVERSNKEADIDAKKIERDGLKNINRDDTQEAKFKALETEIKSYSGLSDDDYDKKIEKEIIEKKKKERLESAANLVEGRNKVEKKLNWLWGGAKEKAKKIRDSIKEKTGAEKLQDAVKQAVEEETKKTASTPGGTTPPTTPAPTKPTPPAPPAPAPAKPKTP
jgi:hypothetical protein